MVNWILEKCRENYDITKDCFIGCVFKRIYKDDSNIYENEIFNELVKNYGSLSSGQKTRVNLCKSLLNKPRLLLLDEPTASLDISTSEFVRNYIINFQKKNNSTVVITSHDLVEIELMCSYLVILEKGSIFYKGSIKTLIKKNNYKSLKEFFLK